MAASLHEINGFLTSLKTFLPLANSHMVHFISHNMFENVIPRKIQQEIDSLEIKEFESIVLNSFTSKLSPEATKSPFLNEFINNVQMLYLRESKLCLDLKDLCNQLGSRKSDKECNPHLVKNLMSVKKGHEVEMMSSIIAALAGTQTCSHIVDVGGGKGYLSSFLSLKHKLKVLSVDSSLVTSKGAAKRIPKVEKAWNNIEKKSTPIPSENPEEGARKESSELCKLATLFITDETNIVEVVKKHFPQDTPDGIMLVGLHTCGNLAASSLRMFVDSPEDVRCLVNVGCCYHLLVEDFDLNPPWLDIELQTSGTGFPLSAVFREEKFSLGRNARMLAAHSPERVSSMGLVETEVLFYRALLETYLEKKLCPSNGLPHYRVGKIGKKCCSFVDYVHKSVKRLELDIKVDDEELKQLYDSHALSRKRLHAFFLLRLLVAPAIEAAIMIDRLLFLREQGIQDAFLTKVFDPVVSPRCYAIIAFTKCVH